MAQADYIISNQTFPNTRADINSHLQAIATNNSGTSAPTTQYAGQFWIDTTSSTWTLYIHDGADDIQFATIDTSANTVNFIDSELGDNSVTTAKIADANVTSAKLSYPLTTFSSTGIDDNATSTAITIDSSGDVGINISSPNLNPFNKAVTLSGTTNAGYELAKGSTLHGAFAVQGDDRVQVINFQNADLTFNTGTSATERMRIDHSTGNVGIGTSSPAPEIGSDTVLEVAGSSSPGLVINDTGQAQKYQLYADSTKFKMSYGSTGFFTYDASNGNSGFGTSTPKTKLHVKDGTDINVRIGSLGSVPSVYATNDAGSYQAFRIDANPLIINTYSGGNVGIGTTTPSQKLDVVGSIEVSDGIYIGGTGTANKLDDYEEGTWTPSIATAGGTLSVTYAERPGKYTKIGNVVYYEFYIETSAFSGGTGSITFSGFPFTAQSGRGAIGLAAGSRIDLGIESTVIIPTQNTSDFRIFIKNSTGKASSDNLTVLDASDWSNLNPTLIYGSGHYRTDA
jgi:hypothetical protein